MHSPIRFIPDILIKHRPIHLTLFLTKRCNARCSFCFYSAVDDTKSAKEELTLSEYEKISNSFGSLLWLAFSGGEIFLRNDLPELAQMFYKNNSPTIMLFPTNGLMTERIVDNIEKILKTCTKSTIAVKLSLDGIDSAHDEMRGVKGAFAQVIKTYNALSPLLSQYPNFELGINTVFCAENQNNINEIIDYVSTMDMIKTHTISLIRGDFTDESQKQIDMNKYLSAIKRLESGLMDGTQATYSFKGARLKAAQDIIQRRLIYKTSTQNKCQTPCHAGRLNLVITEKGDLYPCEEFTDELFMGNLKSSSQSKQGQSENGLNYLINSDKAKAVLRTIKDGCFCTHECFLMTNILFSPRLYPELFKEYLKLIFSR